MTMYFDHLCARKDTSVRVRVRVRVVYIDSSVG